MSRRPSRAVAGIVFMLGAAMLSGCGQSGPLYLPPPAKHAPPPAARHAPPPATAAGTTPAPATSRR